MREEPRSKRRTIRKALYAPLHIGMCLGIAALVLVAVARRGMAVDTFEEGGSGVPSSGYK